MGSTRSSTHWTPANVDEIDEFCDRIALIDRGRIAAIGTPSELKAHWA
jgi:ABC-type multidrug transport system ATPase subunit